MQAQFHYLIEVSELPHVTFRMIPFDAGAPGHAGLLMFSQFSDAAIPDVIYVDTMAEELFLKKWQMFAGMNSSSSISVEWPPATGSQVADPTPEQRQFLLRRGARRLVRATPIRSVPPRPELIRLRLPQVCGSRLWIYPRDGRPQPLRRRIPGQAGRDRPQRPRIAQGMSLVLVHELRAMIFHGIAEQPRLG
jgi:hypothetical protein